MSVCSEELDQREYDVRILTNSNLVPLCKDTRAGTDFIQRDAWKRAIPADSHHNNTSCVFRLNERNSMLSSGYDNEA
eukprot:1954436-Amphidinium_carterae.1